MNSQVPSYFSHPHSTAPIRPVGIGYTQSPLRKRCPIPGGGFPSLSANSVLCLSGRSSESAAANVSSLRHPGRFRISHRFRRILQLFIRKQGAHSSRRARFFPSRPSTELLFFFAGQTNRKGSGGRSSCSARPSGKARLPADNGSAARKSAYSSVHPFLYAVRSRAVFRRDTDYFNRFPDFPTENPVRGGGAFLCNILTRGAAPVPSVFTVPLPSGEPVPG